MGMNHTSCLLQCLCVSFIVKVPCFPCFTTYFIPKIIENDFSLCSLKNGFALGPNLENLLCLKNSIMEC